MQKKGKRKLIAVILSLAMVITALPMSMVTAYAGVMDDKDVDVEWGNFRNSQDNNGITNSPTPSATAETVEKWAKKYGTGWAAAPTPPLILNNKLYIGVADQVIELDKETGEELKRSDKMIGNVGYAMNPITYADGMLFVQVGNGRIQALDLKTLRCVWYAQNTVKGQTLCPISYVKIGDTGYIYSGTWNSETGDGSYFCVALDNGGITPTDEEKGGGKVKALKWEFIPSKEDPDVNESPRGFYWAGAYASENYIAVGSDDGSYEGDYEKGAAFYTLNPLTGIEIDSIHGIEGDIRTTTVFHDGYLYFSTKGGVLYKAKVTDDGRFTGGASSIDLKVALDSPKTMTTATPLIYGDKIYMGASGSGGQFDPDGGHSFCVISNEGNLSNESLLYKLPIKGYPQASALASTAYEASEGRLYIYFTYNAPPGGIYYVYDEIDSTEAPTEEQFGEIFVPEKDKQQYCISTICTDDEGTLYYKNDSCYLMAVTTNKAYINNITVTGGEGGAVSWNQTFKNSVMNYDLKVPADMKTMTIDVDVNKDMTVTIDGEPYTGTTEVALPEGDSSIKVEVSTMKDGESYTRAYVLNIVRIKSVSTLSDLKITDSNSTPTKTKWTITPEFSPEVTEYYINMDEHSAPSSKFYRIWYKTADENATVEIEYDGEKDNVKRHTNNNNNKRFNVYYDDFNENMSFNLVVTAEDGESKTTYKFHFVHPVKVEGVTLDKNEASINVNDTLQLNATVTPENATNKTVNWYSSNEEIATVDENGLVTPKKAGEVTITAIAADGNSYYDTCTITVTENKVPITGITLSKVSEMFIGDVVQLEATVTPDDATNKGITWTSSDDSIATVDDNGKVTALKAGKVTITATSESNDSIKATCTISVKAKENQGTGGNTGGGTVVVPSTGTDRLAGDDRFQTAFKVADQLKKELGVSKFNSVVVAYSDEFADALSATALAADKEAPILLVKPGKESDVKDYIDGNLKDNGTVYIVGGTAVVSEKFEKSLDGFTVKRLGGADRYETNLLVLKELGLNGKDTFMVASGLEFPDALSASSTGKAIMLVGKDLTESQKAYVKTLGGNDSYYIIGGTAAVNAGMESALKELKAGSVDRLSGEDRYETSVAVAEKFYGKAKTMYVASGKAFPDGLTGGALASADKAPLVLVSGSETGQPAAEFAEKAGVRNVTAIGGQAAISDKELNSII